MESVLVGTFALTLRRSLRRPSLSFSPTAHRRAALARAREIRARRRAVRSPHAVDTFIEDNASCH